MKLKISLFFITLICIVSIVSLSFAETPRLVDIPVPPNSAGYADFTEEDAEAADTEEGQTTDEAGEEQTAAGETEEEKQDTANDGADSEKADSNADAQDTNTEDSSQEGAE